MTFNAGIEAAALNMTTSDDLVSRLQATVPHNSEYGENAREAADKIVRLTAERDDARKAANLGCDARDGGPHTIMSDGSYKFCTACGETVKTPTLQERARRAESRISDLERQLSLPGSSRDEVLEKLHAFVVEHYADQDMNHMDFRVEAYVIAAAPAQFTPPVAFSMQGRNKRMDKSALLKLADRAEKLAGPDREIDCQVYETLGAKAPVGTLPYWISPDGKNSHYESSIPKYTESLDAAAALIGNNWWSIEAGCDGTFFAKVLPWAVDCRGGAASNAAIPAIAITAACLRALAHKDSSDAS